MASVDNVAITGSDVERAYRVELLLNGEAPTAAPDAATLELVRDHLINQILLLREADADKIPTADSPEVANVALTDIRKKFGSEAAFQAALQLLNMNERQVLERLRERERVLLLIDRRLRPSARVETPDIETYYQKTFVPEFTARGKGAVPAMVAVESQIREILTQQRIDKLLTTWLDNLKLTHRVRVHSV